LGAERIYKVGGAVTAPSVIQKVDPNYTEEAKEAGIQGKVLLKAVIGSDGIALDIVVAEGIDPALDQNAVDALRKWRFRPATRNSKPVATTAKNAVNFRLQ
jgi:protein TonB